MLQSLSSDDPCPHILLLEGHDSHIYDMEFLNLMKDNNVCILGLPLHTTHDMQLADRDLFKCLRHYWRLEGRDITSESGVKG